MMSCDGYGHASIYPASLQVASLTTAASAERKMMDDLRQSLEQANRSAVFNSAKDADYVPAE